MGQNHFWAGFWERGHDQNLKMESPPYRGVQRAAAALCAGGLAHARSFDMRCTVPDPLADELDHVEKPALGRWHEAQFDLTVQ